MYIYLHYKILSSLVESYRTDQILKSRSHDLNLVNKNKTKIKE